MINELNIIGEKGVEIYPILYGWNLIKTSLMSFNYIMYRIVYEIQYQIRYLVGPIRYHRSTNYFVLRSTKTLP